MVRAKSRNGFTLVELLIVIGIIAMLISVLLPALAKARAAAQLVVCETNLHQFGLGIQMYADQNKGAMPQKGPDGSSPGANSFGSAASGVIGYDDPSIWFNAIPPMVNGKSYFQMMWDDFVGSSPLPKDGFHNIFICPAAGASSSLSTIDHVSNGYFLLYGTESATNPQQITNTTGLVPRGYFKFASSYVFNSKLTSSISQPTDSAIKMSSLRPTSQVVLMVEKITQGGEYRIPPVQQYNANYRTAYFTTSNGVGNEITSAGFVNNIGQSKADWRRFTTRHNNGGNLLFADGHVSWFSWTEAQIQPSEMPGGSYNPNLSDANQPNKMIWSVMGPVN